MLTYVTQKNTDMRYGWRKKEERKEVGELKNKINSGLH